MNCMVMLDAADLGPLLQYQACMERMLERYGERAWALLHQADVRARLEEWPLADRDRLWTEELIEPALIVMAGRTALKTLVQDDARTSRPKFAADLKPPLADASAATIRPRNTNRSGHVHETSEGRYLKNRTGHSLCPDFRATNAPRLSKEPGASRAQLGAPVRQMFGMAPCQSVHIQRCLRWDEPHARERPKARRERAKGRPGPY